MPVADWRMLPEEVNLTEAKEIVRRRRVSLLLMFAAVWMLIGLMHLTILPRLEQTYSDLGVEVTLVDQRSTLLLAAIMVTMAAGISPLVVKNWEPELKRLAEVSEVPGRLNTRLLPGSRYERYILMGFGLAVIYLVAVVAAPIYNLSGGK